MSRQRSESEDVERRSSRASLPLVAAAVALIGGYLLGSAGDRPARADRYARGAADLTIVETDPPAIALDATGWALVGANDGRYYIIRSDGVAFPVKGLRPHQEPNRTDPDLFWK